MEIRVIHVSENSYYCALLGLGLSYGLTSDATLNDIKYLGYKKDLRDIASKLAKKDASERKFLRMLHVILDIKASLGW